jgi:hypothetical protein
MSHSAYFLHWLYVVGRVEADTAVFPAFTPALLVFVLQLLKHLTCKNGKS